MASENVSVAGLAGRYATALFELATEAKALDAIASDLSRLKALIDGSPDLARLVRSHQRPRRVRDDGRHMVD